MIVSRLKAISLSLPSLFLLAFHLSASQNVPEYTEAEHQQCVRKEHPTIAFEGKSFYSVSDSNRMIHLGLVCVVFPYNCDPRARGSGLTNRFPFDALQCFSSEVSQQSIQAVLELLV